MFVLIQGCPVVRYVPAGSTASTRYLQQQLVGQQRKRQQRKRQQRKRQQRKHQQRKHQQRKHQQRKHQQHEGPTADVGSSGGTSDSSLASFRRYDIMPFGRNALLCCYRITHGFPRYAPDPRPPEVPGISVCLVVISEFNEPA